MMTAIVGFTGRSIAGEVDRGTLALTMARPIPRTNVYLARLVGLVILIVLFAVSGPIATWLGLVIAKPSGDVGISQLATLGALCGLLAWSVGGLTLMVSAASNTTGRVVGWATGFLVVSFFVDYFAELWSVLEPIRPLSIFWYFDTTATIVDGAVPVKSMLVLGGSGVIGVVIGWRIFERRDLGIRAKVWFTRDTNPPLWIARIPIAMRRKDRARTQRQSGSPQASQGSARECSPVAMIEPLASRDPERFRCRSRKGHSLQRRTDWPSPARPRLTTHIRGRRAAPRAIVHWQGFGHGHSPR